MNINSFLSTKATPATNIVTLDRSSPHFRKEHELDKFKVKNQHYQRCNKIVTQVNGKRKREPRSIAFKDSAFGEKVLRLADGKVCYYCYLCERQKKVQQLPVLSGTKGALDHLREDHRIDKAGNKLTVELEAGQQQLPPKVFTAVTTYDYSEFKRLLVRWIVYCFIAFRMLENDYFRQLLHFTNEGLAKLLPKAASTIRLWIEAEYKAHKEVVKDELHVAISNIHFSFDLWTSPNYYAILSVYGYFISNDGKRCNRLLAFRRLRGSHSGENQAELLLEVINEYDIGAKIGFFVCDNAQSNDTCVAAVLKRLYPTMKKQQAVGRRLRCIGHITNLCAQAMLLGKGAGKAVAELERKAAKGAEGVIESFWRGRGAVGRLHNIVKYIRMTPQRREAFGGTQNPQNLMEFDGLNVSCPKVQP